MKAAEQLGYEEVIVHTSDLDSVYEDVAEGDLDAFQASKPSKSRGAGASGT